MSATIGGREPDHRHGHAGRYRSRWLRDGGGVARDPALLGLGQPCSAPRASAPPLFSSSQKRPSIWPTCPASPYPGILSAQPIDFRRRWSQWVAPARRPFHVHLSHLSRKTSPPLATVKEQAPGTRNRGPDRQAAHHTKTAHLRCHTSISRKGSSAYPLPPQIEDEDRACLGIEREDTPSTTRLRLTPLGFGQGGVDAAGLGDERRDQQGRPARCRDRPARPDPGRAEQDRRQSAPAGPRRRHSTRSNSGASTMAVDRRARRGDHPSRPASLHRILVVSQTARELARRVQCPAGAPIPAGRYSYRHGFGEVARLIHIRCPWPRRRDRRAAAPAPHRPAARSADGPWAW